MAYKKCVCALSGFYSAFFYAGTHEFVYMFFCLDAKEPKNQGYDAFAKNGFRSAKMPELAPAAPTLRTAGIF